MPPSRACMAAARRLSSSRRPHFPDFFKITAHQAFHLRIPRFRSTAIVLAHIFRGFAPVIFSIFIKVIVRSNVAWYSTQSCLVGNSIYPSLPFLIPPRLLQFSASLLFPNPLSSCATLIKKRVDTVRLFLFLHSTSPAPRGPSPQAMPPVLPPCILKGPSGHHMDHIHKA